LTDFAKTKGGMFNRFNWMDTSFLLTVGTLLAWSLMQAIVAGTYLEFTPFISLIRIFFIMAVLRVIFYSRGTLIFAGAVVAVTLLILLFDAIVFTSPTEMASYNGYMLLYTETGRQYPMFIEIVNFISGTIGFVTGFEFYTPEYDAAVQWALSISLALFIFVFGFFWFNFFAILTTVLIFGLVLSTGFFFYHLSFYVFIFCVVAYLIRYLNLRSMGTRLKNSQFSLYALPFAAVCLAVAIALPTPQAGAAEQFTENFIRRPFTNLNQSLQAAFAPRYFSLAQTGFGAGNTRRLGGNVTANYDIFMRINHPGPIYLTGNIFDRYTGFSWINSFDEEYYILDFNEPGPNIEAFELLTSQFTMNLADDFIDNFIEAAMHHEERLRLWNIGHAFFGRGWTATAPRPEAAQELLARATVAYLDEGRLLVEHDVRKFTVFTTGLVSNITPPDENTNFLRDANGSMQSDVLMARGARYVIYYVNLPDNIDTAELLAASHHGLYQDVYNRMRQVEAAYDFSFNYLPSPMHHFMYFHHNGILMHYDELLREHLIPRADRINTLYTELPEHFPERVSRLAHYVIEQTGAVTNFEKAIALEGFLRSTGGFGYSLAPGNTPLDRDFVDHFLFDLQTGYCVHFASAFVTMARAVGLPTRYLEGFIVSGNADGQGYLSVINRQGHAWAEVYFEGFGWHRFDPTPPAAVFAWPQALNGDHLLYFDYEYFLAGQPFPWAGLFPDEWEYMYMDPELMYAMMGGRDEGPAFNVSITQIILWSLMITSALTIALLGGRVIYFEGKKLSVIKKSNNDAAVAYFHQMLRYMRLFRYEIEPHETALAFGTRVGTRVGFDKTPALMVDLSRIFSRARYGNEEIDDKERRLMADAVKSLDRRLWLYVGPRKYVLYKYIMCVV
jgi:transglutaminase-like putative cysteine protease